MTVAGSLFLIGCLLQGAWCQLFEVTVPTAVNILRGSCVTIPCSFTVETRYQEGLDNTCDALWKTKNNIVAFHSREHTEEKGELRGILQERDCTTTLNNVEKPGETYYFRLECARVKYDFWKQGFVNILVREDVPRPTVTPSTLTVREGTSVSLKCSAPAPCLSHPPALTWSPSLAGSPEELQESHNKTIFKTSVVNFMASHLHHGKEISCTATYSRQDGSTASFTSTTSAADVSFSPRILSSSDCSKAAEKLNCSCVAEGNPPPTLQWYLDGLPVNHSGQLAISNEALDGTAMRSIITVSQPQERDLSTLLCASSNSLGSATQRFYVYILETQTSTESQDHVTVPVFITTTVALLLLVCALLWIIRAQKTHHECVRGISTGAMSELLTSGDGTEVPNTPQEDIYVNINVPRQANVARPAATSEANSSTLPGHAGGHSESSEKTNEDVIYSAVNWKRRSRKKDESVGSNQSASSYMEEERCMLGGMSRSSVSNAVEMGNFYEQVRPRSVRREVETEYAHVKFKDKSAEHT